MTSAPPAQADAELTEEQQDFVRAVRDFCKRECGPERLGELTHGFDDLHNEDIARRMAELGWYGVGLDEEYGGSGGGLLEACLFLEETAHGEAPIGAYPVTLIVASALERFGTEDQKHRLLGHVAGGGALAIAMSEPEAGSDVGALSTRAERANGEWVLDGTKMWCSYAHKAREILIVCRTERGASKHDGLSMIFVPREAEGLTVTPIETLGGKETNELHLEDCRVSDEALLGEPGGGWTQLMAGLNQERVILAASALGLAQRAFDEALAYAKERKQFGRPIGSFQATQHKLADLATELVQARLLVRSVARMSDSHPERMLPREASMAKLACSELARRSAIEGLQIMGGYGYATEYPMERYLRGAVVTTIFGGTSEIQKNIIAKTLGL
ncbi:MAG TPA: acyl-CoA dehydrogenase family protein [Thermoleophilaceae bacterium]|nr:acyl-CoA dehydrogenase family protein [Thermoleophilaceae bacterium]